MMEGEDELSQSSPDCGAQAPGERGSLERGKRKMERAVDEGASGAKGSRRRLRLTRYPQDKI